MSMLDKTSSPADAELLSRLKALAKRKLTAQEREDQRVSFILAGLPDGTNISRSTVAEFVRDR